MVGQIRVYQELLTVRRNANEVYLVPAPEELVGLGFTEVSEMFLKYRNDRRSCPVIRTFGGTASAPPATARSRGRDWG